MKKLTVLSSLLVLITGCDPFQRIRMKNDTADEGEIVIFIKEDSIHRSPFFISNSKEVRFLVRPGKNGTIHLSCGIGNWTPSAVKNLADDLESIKIRSSGNEVHLASEEEITAFLLSRRTGLDKGTIDIRIQNP